MQVPVAGRCRRRGSAGIHPPPLPARAVRSAKGRSRARCGCVLFRERAPSTRAVRRWGAQNVSVKVLSDGSLQRTVRSEFDRFIEYATGAPVKIFFVGAPVSIIYLQITALHPENEIGICRVWPDITSHDSLKGIDIMSHKSHIAQKNIMAIPCVIYR